MSDRLPRFSLLSGLMGFGRCPAPEPMTNAGRYLQQLDVGDSRFARTEENVSEELLAGLRRIQITTSKEPS
ncbi:hypothetical protein [Stenotrophomonas sp. SrG]|uniref:hypothetical protein n=1 Tax=Stenotrophomonas sp. SrG TaxID=3414430 RepID=UPI003CFA1406